MEMVYKAPQVWFHSFEADNNMAGLSFADERQVLFINQKLSPDEFFFNTILIVELRICIINI